MRKIDARLAARALAAGLVLFSWGGVGAQDFPGAKTARLSGDTTITPTPTYLNPIVDPFYGATITLVTGNPGTPMLNTSRTWPSRVQLQYPSFQSWNADGSIFYAQFGRVWIDGNPPHEPLNLPAVPGTGLPQWSPAEPDIMMIATSSGVAKYNVRTGSIVQSVNLPGYSGFTFNIRTSPSEDGTRVGVKATRASDNHVVCIAVDFPQGGAARVISFNDHQYGPFTRDEAHARRCSVTGEGSLIWLDGQRQVSGTNFYNDQARAFSISSGALVYTQRTNNGIECPGDHGDIGVYQGRPVFVGRCDGGPVGQTLGSGSFSVVVDILTGDIRRAGAGGTHTSCRNTARNDWCYVSSFMATSAQRANRLDGGRTEWYADLQDYDGSPYFDNAMAVPSPDGTMVAFNSTWNNTISGDARTFFLDLSNLAGGVTPPPPDTTAPTVPSGVAARALSSSSIEVTWQASTDDVGVTSYEIDRGGVVHDTVAGTVLSYVDDGLVPETTYTYRVRARDAAGNFSALSSSVSVTTDAGPPPPPPDDTTPPTVTFISPVDGGTVARKSSVPVTFEIMDLESTPGATLAIDGSNICSVMGSGQHTCTWRTSGRRGSATLAVTATSAGGQIISQIMVTIR